MNTNTTQTTTEITDALTRILHRYTELLSETGDQWGATEEATVRQVRDILVRAGADPMLSREVRAHIDYRFFGTR